MSLREGLSAKVAEDGLDDGRVEAMAAATWLKDAGRVIAAPEGRRAGQTGLARAGRPLRERSH